MSYLTNRFIENYKYNNYGLIKSSKIFGVLITTMLIKNEIHTIYY